MSHIDNISRRSALTLFGGAALSSNAWAQAPGGKVLKIGALCSVTGPSASIGKEGLSGLLYTVKKLNEAGGVKIGPDTYRIEFINADDESKPERAVAAAERLITGEKVSVIFTSPATTPTMAMLPIAERNKTLAISFVASGPSVVSPEYSYSFRNTLSSIMNVAPAIGYLVKDKGVKTLAYLGRNDDWGRTAGKQAIAKATELGASVVAEEYFDNGNTDFYGLLTKVRAANPDALAAAAFIEDGVPLVKQFRELRMKPLLMSLGVIWSSPTFLKSAGKAADGVYISTGPTTSASPALAAFGAEFEKATGRAPLPYDVTAYDSLMMVLAAMKQAGSVDPTIVRDALKSLTYEGLLQTYAFNGGRQSEVVININEVRNGEVVKISSQKAV